MSHDKAVGRPVKDAPDSFSRRGFIRCRHPEFARHGRRRGGHQIKSGHQRSPAAIPAPWDLLNQVSHQNRGRLAMVEHGFRREPVAAYDDLVESPAPCGVRFIVKGRVDSRCCDLLRQTGRSVDLRIWIAGRPFRKKRVMQTIGSDEMTDRTKRVDCPAKILC